MFEWFINTMRKHKYLGVGNDLYCGEPIDEDDKIAFYHDLDYTLADSYDDILLADKVAIQRFFNLKTLHGYIAGSLLQLKHLAEINIGRVLYPNINKYTKSEKNAAKILQILYTYYDENINKPQVMSFEEFVCTDIAKNLIKDVSE
ncbi:hypothetical protein [Neodiprion sertifer nucleopolyhedrovirus]|uniref:Phospholipase A2-like domain-containing protein n=1 Tax=Neodiprion sertifer nucleopolyhedrovirus TaxID=111874 RepID=Q6JK77_9CBAC|nr:hypothetical protein NeseNPV_gp83 [Neodiprion sertifer nucleopolyhedrovirus]AAQ96460.1 hypothetical protein [Neodiprion sertifer nucleopolyhedrovirus]UZH98387.1 hypothetical protein NeseNPV-TR_ORF76 [Neodiprion sertifer nucleopolyhedrovirus]